MKRRGRGGRALVLTVLSAVLGLSGCFKVNQDVKVRSDGSGTVVLHGEVNKKAIAALSDLGAGAGLTATLRPIEMTFPDGSKVRSVDGPERSTFDASFSFSGPDEYRRKLRQVVEASSTNPDLAAVDEGSIAVRRVGDRMEVALDIGSSGFNDFDLSKLTGVLDREALPEAVVTLTMPGVIMDTNGTGKGRTATWDLLRPGAPSMLTASSKVAKPGLPSWAVPAGVGLVLALLLAIVGVIASAGRRSRRPTGIVVPYQPPPPPPPGGQAGPGTFFPARGGLPPREPVAWPETPPSEPATPPEPPGEPWAGAAGADAVPPAGGLPARGPAGAAPLPDPAPPEPDPLPWRVPDAGDAEAPSTSEPEPAHAVTSEPTAPVPPMAEYTAPVPPAAAPVPGWYADPAGGPGVRYWDGGTWTDHTG